MFCLTNSAHLLYIFCLTSYAYLQVLSSFVFHPLISQILWSVCLPSSTLTLEQSTLLSLTLFFNSIIYIYLQDSSFPIWTLNRSLYQMCAIMCMVCFVCECVCVCVRVSACECVRAHPCVCAHACLHSHAGTHVLMHLCLCACVCVCVCVVGSAEKDTK